MFVTFQIDDTFLRAISTQQMIKTIMIRIKDIIESYKLYKRTRYLSNVIHVVMFIQL